jgi:glutamyl-tRNA reductase
MRPRRNQPLFVIDIALPRDVEAAAGEIEQVFLYNIDDLQATVRENLERRASEVARAETIVADELNRFDAWFRARGAIPTVVALRQHFDHIRRAELERLDFKLTALPPEARDEARARIDEITHLIVEKLLLAPTEQLKSLGDADTIGVYSEAVARLFRLAGTPDETTHREHDGPQATREERSERIAGRIEPFSRTKPRGQR